MIKSNFDSYKKALDKEIARQIREQHDTFRKLVFTTYNSVITLTPVDKGYLRSNNLIKAHNPDNSYDETKLTNPTAQVTEANGTLGSTPIKDGTKIFITNNLPYADRIEYEGWSKKAPSGFFGISEEKTRQLINRMKQEKIKGKKI